MTDDRPGGRAPPTRGLVPQARLVALFAVYLVLLAWVVLWKLERPVGRRGGVAHRQARPVRRHGGAGASTPFDVVANLALFVPFGVYLGLLAPSWPWWKVAGAAAAASLGLEVAQYVLAVGSSDLTDVVVNTAGGLVGLGLLALARRRLRARTAAVLTRVCTIGTVLAVLAGALVVASPLRYGPPEDVRCTSSAPCGPPGAPGVTGCRETPCSPSSAASRRPAGCATATSSRAEDGRRDERERRRRRRAAGRGGHRDADGARARAWARRPPAACCSGR